MASVKILVKHIESGALSVMEISDRDPVDARMLKAAGFLPLKVLPKQRESTGAPAGFRSASAFLRT